MFRINKNVNSFLIGSSTAQVNQWVDVSNGLNSSCFSVILDNSNNLYAGGSFSQASDLSVNRIARWNGVSWNRVGNGVVNTNDISKTNISSIAYDASNNHILVGGTFTRAGDISANNIARWNGSTWQTFSNGVNGSVNAVALDNSFNVYTGGNFTSASGQTALNIARWNGVNWNSLSLPTAISQYTFGGEVFTQNITSNQLVTIECWGSGGQTGGGLGANGGKGGYSSTTFTPSSSGQLKIVVGQSGVNAGAGGYSTSGSAFGGNGGGASYVYFGSGSSFDLKCVAGGGGGGGAGVGGGSNGTGGNSSSNGANGGPFGDQPTGGLGAVGSTPGSGGIDKPDGTPTNSGSGPMSLNVSEVGLLLAYNGANASTSSLPGNAFGAGGGGGSGYAGGGAGGFDSLQSNNEGAGGGGGSNFGDIFLSDGTTASSYPGGGIATANNNGFVRITVSTGIFGVGPDISANVNAIVSDQSNNVFVGGTFTQAGDQSCNNIARWSGSAWFPVGLGINNTVHALVFDNSNNLYAGGNFTRAGDISANFIARWNGTSWSPLSQQVNNTVYDLAFANNNLYAVGSFTQAGNIDAKFVAVWDGNNWQSLNSNNFNGIAGRSIVVKNNLIYLGGTFITPLNIGNYIQRTVNSTYIIPINNLGKQTKRIL